MPFKSATCRSLLLLSLGLAALGCGDKQASKATSATTTPSVPRHALEAEVPVLRWIPPEPDLVAVAGSLAELLRSAQQLASLAPQVDLTPLGDRPFDAALWKERGVDAKAPAALFISGATMTAVLPTTAKGKLSAWAQENYQGDTERTTHKGLSVARSQYGQALWSWLEVEGFFVMHVAVASGPSAEETNMAWLDAMLLASQGRAYSSDPEAQAAHAFGKAGEVWGSASPLSLLATLVGGQDRLACTGLLGKLEGMVFAASLQGQRAAFRSALELAEEDLASLRPLLSTGPTEGMRAQRIGAGVYASLALDLQQTGAALREAACPELAGLIENPTSAVGWSPPPRAVHLAGTHLRPKNLSGNVALEVSLRSKRFVKSQLDNIPMRSFFETSMTVEGVRLKRLSIPTMSSLYYHLSNERLVFGSKKGIIQTLLKAPSQAAPSAAELLALGIWPQKLPQLGTLLRELIPQRQEREAVAAILSRIDHASSAAELKGSRLGLRVELELRAGVASLW